MNSFYTNVAVSGDYILVRGYEGGKAFNKSIKYEPYLFMQCRDISPYKTLFNENVKRIDFISMRDARSFIKENKNVPGLKIYGLDKFAYTYIYDEYKRFGDINYDPSIISVCPLDIEVSIADGKGFPDIQVASNPVTLITIGDRTGKLVCLGCGDYVNNDSDVEYYKCADEEALLRSFLILLNSPRFQPDVFTGWNIEFFDIPYLINRITRVMGSKWARKISPWGKLQERTLQIMGKDVQIYIPMGVSILDYMQLYKKFAYTQQESYRLDHIAQEELGEKKLEFKGTLAELEVNDYQTYCAYNIHDVRLIYKLDDKLKLIELVYAMAYDAGVNYQDTFTTVGLWDVIIHNHLMNKNIVIPPYERVDSNEPVLGGYVKDPQVGMHKWVVSLDLNSLYPSIIMQYNISPETFVGWQQEEGMCDNKEQARQRVLKALDNGVKKYEDVLKRSNTTMTANMCLFTREKQGFLPEIMQKLYNDRVVYKGMMLKAKQEYELHDSNKVQLIKDIAKFNNFQQNKKITLNSGYGALANVWNRWFRREFAEAITSSGQLTTMWIERKLNNYLNKLLNTENIDYVIACDTDSVYITLETLISKVFDGDHEAQKDKILKFMDKVCTEKLEPYIDKCYDELCGYVNGYQQKMKMKRECIADKGIWVATKRYILNVYNQEGVQYATPKLKMMGIEAIRTSTPAVIRDGIKHALKVIMEGSERKLQDYVSSFYNDYKTMSFEQISFPRSVSDLDKYKDMSTIYAKGTPINVKGALIYNHYLKKLSLDKKYEPISPGQKIKYAYCITPNPLNCTVIACPSELPIEFDMHNYIDYDTQWEKSFIEPIKNITDAIGWSVKRRSSLEALFK